LIAKHFTVYIVFVIVLFALNGEGKKIGTSPYSSIISLSGHRITPCLLEYQAFSSMQQVPEPKKTQG